MDQEPKEIHVSDLFDPNKAEEAGSFMLDHFSQGKSILDLWDFPQSILEDKFLEARNYLRDGIPDKALEILTPLAMNDPYQIRYWVALAQAAILNEDFETAEIYSDIALCIDEKSPNLLFQLAYCQAEQGKTNEAISTLSACKGNCALQQDAEILQSVEELLHVLQS